MRYGIFTCLIASLMLLSNAFKSVLFSMLWMVLFSRLFTSELCHRVASKMSFISNQVPSQDSSYRELGLP